MVYIYHDPANRTNIETLQVQPARSHPCVDAAPCYTAMDVVNWWPSPRLLMKTMQHLTISHRRAIHRFLTQGSGLAVLLTGAGLAVLMAGCPVSKYSKKKARPWQPKLVGLFDDATDVCAPWVASKEPWARREHEQTAKRTQETDLVAEGQIEEVVDTLSGAAVKQVVLQFHAQKMLRGSFADMPEGKPRITLVVSRSEDNRIPKKMLRRTAVLSIRWLQGDDPPFRWHLTCATKGVIPLVKRHLKGRARKEAHDTPQP